MPSNPKKVQSKSKIAVNASPVPPIMDPAVQEQFESELYWCIQQLKSAVNSGKLNDKQLKDNVKAMNQLMSDKTPIVQKRQVMRLSFGDYRSKMAEEEKKMSKSLANIKISSTVPNNKSVFVKKSQNDFKFNFDVDKSGDNGEIGNSSTEIENRSHSENFHFVPSNNSFKFNFSTSDCDDL